MLETLITMYLGGAVALGCLLAAGLLSGETDMKDELMVDSDVVVVFVVLVVMALWPVIVATMPLAAAINRVRGR